jgi:hypothetical protein
MTETNELKRKILIAELREALKSKAGCRDATVLRFCNLTNATLKADIEFTAVPWEALRFHYYMLGIRALRIRRAGQIPNGKSYRERIAVAGGSRNVPAMK